MAEFVAAVQGVKRRSVLAVALTALLSACSVVPKSPPKTVETPQSQGPAIGLPTDATRHRIALLVPLTGTNAGVGQSIANAATMAVLDTGGKLIRVTTYDTAGGAQAAAEKAISDGNKMILGPLLSEDARAVSAVARSARVPVVSFSNDVSVAGQGTFVMGFVPTQSVDRIVGYARAKGLTRFGGLIPAGLYGQRASAALTRAVEASGGRLVGLQNFERSAASIQSAVLRLNQQGSYDALLIADSGRVAIQVVPLIRKGPNKAARILGTELWNTETFISGSAPMSGAWFASVSDNLYNQLAAKYRAKYQTPPYRLSSLGYDSVLLVTKIASKWRVGQPFPLAELTDTGGFTGIDGAFRFGNSGVAERALEVQQVNPGSFSVVEAATRSFTR
jgi:branched-chain amino acid transport system substrate-binding protein